MPQFTVDDHQIEVVEEIRCLGLIVRADLKWISNTRYIVRRAYQKLWIVKRLKNLGAHTADLVDIFEKHVRSVLEFGTTVWHPSITQSETIDIERVQKSFCRIVLGDQYVSYANALETLSLETLETRREALCLNFAPKAERHDKFKHWFKPSIKTTVTRLKPPKYVPVYANHARFENSPLSYLTKLLNEFYA